MAGSWCAPRLRTSQKEIRLLVDRECRVDKKQARTGQSHLYPYRSQAIRQRREFLLPWQPYPLEIVNANHPALTFDSKFYLSNTALPNARAVFERWYRKQALEILTDRVQHFASQHGFRVTQVRISSARTRWGSCSARGSLSFTWRLVMAPLPVIDYVVVHELVHLQSAKPLQTVLGSGESAHA